MNAEQRLKQFCVYDEGGAITGIIRTNVDAQLIHYENRVPISRGESEGRIELTKKIDLRTKAVVDKGAATGDTETLEKAKIKDPGSVLKPRMLP